MQLKALNCTANDMIGKLIHSDVGTWPYKQDHGHYLMTILLLCSCCQVSLIE